MRRGKEVRIEASDPRGLFYGAQTLRQLVTTGVRRPRSVPAVDISDAPRFRWRGLLIDVGRHFFGKQTLFKIIDEMAAYKLNVLKLHLTDYEGWRLEIPAYPKLTQVGSLVDGKPQYFTTADMREIVQYAAERHIMVVPEIEMPGHAGAAARSYPEFFNPDGGAFNPANPKTYDFVRGVLTEVARLFPAPYLHFGGDEVGDETWKGMADVDRLKAEQGLKTNQDVQAYFGRKVVGIIESLGKRPMAWDEQVEAHAPKSVVIQWWRRDRPDVLTAAANDGYDLVMSPADQLYFDYHQGPGEPGAPWEGNKGGPQSIAKILAWEPVPGRLHAGSSRLRVLGIEAAVWTEFIADRTLSAVHDLPAPARPCRRSPGGRRVRATRRSSTKRLAAAHRGAARKRHQCAPRRRGRLRVHHELRPLRLCRSGSTNARGISRRNLAAREPAVLRGVARDWPLVIAALERCRMTRCRCSRRARMLTDQ